ncbi:nectin-3-like isoform X2 [Heterodontus francisci]|uniref:nectin-3-like isoform X2 n=1 Tax=Heterodontus francisci TaxID=7792 RepID=UPI00355B037A
MPDLCTGGLRSLMLFMVGFGSAAGGPIKVNGGKIVRSLGDNALLPCTIDTEQVIAQVMWQQKRDEQRRNFFTAVFTNGKEIKYDDIFDGRMTYFGKEGKNASIYLKNITLRDEGTYTCIFTLFPDGPVEEEIQLIVRVPPTVTVQTYPVPSLADCSEHILVTCTAANAKPAADITWETPFTLHANQTIAPSAANGTVTVSSQFHLCPNRSLHGQNIFCVVEHPTLNASKRFPYKLNIYYMSSLIVKAQKTEEGGLHLVCDADANPPATKYIWTKENGPIPEGVRTENDQLKLPKLTPDLNGLYRCEASNTVGTAFGSLYLHTSEHQPRQYIVLFIIIVVLLIMLGILGFLYYKKIPISKEVSPKESPLRPLRHSQKESDQDSPEH